MSNSTGNIVLQVLRDLVVIILKVLAALLAYGFKIIGNILIYTSDLILKNVTK